MGAIAALRRVNLHWRRTPDGVGHVVGILLRKINVVKLCVDKRCYIGSLSSGSKQCNDHHPHCKKKIHVLLERGEGAWGVVL